MFVVSNLLNAVAEILNMVIGALELVVVLRVILSWANADPYNGFVRAIHAISEPLLAPFRKLLPPWRLNGLDLSPVFVLLTLVFARVFLVATLQGFAARL
jgi:YggT family protein